MAARQSKPKKYVLHHKDGTVWAKGQTINDVPTGYWEWFRVDGTLLRSGSFEDGEQVGVWTTYDKQGRPHKVTTMKKKAAATKRAPTVREPADHECIPSGVGKPAMRALEGAGFNRLKQFTKVTEADLLELHGVGPKALRVLREALEQAGYALKGE